MNSHSNTVRVSNQEDVSDYVAHLQIHMSLQARNLLPQINQTQDNRSHFLYETQAMTEKFSSRELSQIR